MKVKQEEDRLQHEKRKASSLAYMNRLRTEKVDEFKAYTEK